MIQILVPAKTRPAARAPAAPAKRAESDLDTVLIWTDGASRGNPGPASVGVIIRSPEGKTIAEVGRTLGTTTNNVAEYHAIRTGLEEALALGAAKAILHADSELVVRQLNGIYQVRNADLRPIYEAVKRLERRFARGVTYKHVRRELNQDADRLANMALDGEI